MSRNLLELLTPTKPGIGTLKICEFFDQTIQGEGYWIGTPSMFLRFSGCHVNCDFCDTKEIWTQGDYYLISEIVETIIRHIGRQHLVITGGSPLLQMKGLEIFLHTLRTAESIQ